MGSTTACAGGSVVGVVGIVLCRVGQIWVQEGPIWAWWARAAVTHAGVGRLTRFWAVVVAARQLLRCGVVGGCGFGQLTMASRTDSFSSACGSRGGGPGH